MDKPNKKKYTTIQVNRDIHNVFKKICVLQEKHIAEVAEELIVSYISSSYTGSLLNV